MGTHQYVFVCLFVLRFYGPVNPMGSCQARSVYLTTLLLGRLSPLKWLTSIMHILSPENDNCPSWIRGRDRMTVENISWSNLHERMLPTRRDRTSNLLITSRTCIQLSHRGQQYVFVEKEEKHQYFWNAKSILSWAIDNYGTARKYFRMLSSNIQTSILIFWCR